MSPLKNHKCSQGLALPQYDQNTSPKSSVMIQSTLYPAVPYAKEAGGVNSHFVGILIGNKCLTPPGQNKQIMWILLMWQFLSPWINYWSTHDTLQTVIVAFHSNRRDSGEWTLRTKFGKVHLNLYFSFIYRFTQLWMIGGGIANVKECLLMLIHRC